MRRVVRVLGAGAGNAAPPIDSVILSGDQRRAQSAILTGVNGTQIGLMWPEPVLLRMGDALELDDGSLVEIVVAPERLVEVRGNDLTHLARLAWHLGDRHVPVQVLANRLRLQRNAALETMLTRSARGSRRSRRRSIRKAAPMRRRSRMTTATIMAMTIITMTSTAATITATTIMAITTIITATRNKALFP